MKCGYYELIDSCNVVASRRYLTDFGWVVFRDLKEAPVCEPNVLHSKMQSFAREQWEKGYHEPYYWHGADL